MELEEVLRKNKLKVTQTRLQILKCYSNSDFALSQLDIEQKLGEYYDRVTIYRTLASFEEKGILHRVHNPEGPAKYNMCLSGCSEHEHFDKHLHFYCSKCNNSYCLDSIEIPQISLPNGYQADSIYMVANGICDSCAVA